jgi:hypothetical protein
MNEVTVVFVEVDFHRRFGIVHFHVFLSIVDVYGLFSPNGTQLQIEGNGRDPVVQDSPLTIKIGEPCS